MSNLDQLVSEHLDDNQEPTSSATSFEALSTLNRLISILTFLLEYAGGYLAAIEPIVALEGALPPLTNSNNRPRHERTAAENCVKIRKLGFTTSSHIKMFGQDFELMSDPFEEDGHTAVRVVSVADQTERTVHLPVSILIGLSDLFANFRPSQARDFVGVQWRGSG